MLGDPLAVHRVLRHVQPDVACLQEAPRRLRSRGRIASLARHSGMLFACGGWASAGTALLTSVRAEAHAAEAVRLPAAGARHHPRGFAAARVAVPGRPPVQVGSIHLGLDDQERVAHAERIRDDLQAAGLPLVIGGDLNERPGGPSWRVLGDVVRDPGAGTADLTFSAERPRYRIDVVLVDPRLEVLSYGWPSGVSEDDVRRASDHRPVLAEIRVPGQ
jgi:endonuclease/exonuclease/phosphatase family metal-dependent hydrolase